ncbi:MAG: 50S ribosomal protein L4 [Candidatus Micrarchaeia archaeon]
MKAGVKGLNGKALNEAVLPRQFSEEYRPDLIRRAFHAERSQLLQPKGNNPGAGLDYTTAKFYGRRHLMRSGNNAGSARLPREKIAGGRLGRVLMVPQARKGMRAHPPKPWTCIIERINYKEKCKAIRSAIAATLDPALVKARGHLFVGELPLVIEEGFESVKRVSDAADVLDKLGLEKDLERARLGRRLRSGRARLRKGGYRQPSSALIVYAKDDGISKATRNIPGVDCVNVKELTAELLAPGGDAGRLTVWTAGALRELEKQELYCA